jgi:UTP-glucose-1-phosphate uridylyltransferase
MRVPTNALIVAGGRGTRLLPLTEQVPKPMLPFCGAPFLAGLARRLGAAGVRGSASSSARTPNRSRRCSTCWPRSGSR